MSASERILAVPEQLTLVAEEYAKGALPANF
jgi:hypothetical protein